MILLGKALLNIKNVLLIQSNDKEVLDQLVVLGVVLHSEVLFVVLTHNRRLANVRPATIGQHLHSERVVVSIARAAVVPAAVPATY